MGLARTTRAEIEDLGAVVTEGAALAPLTTLRLGPVAATLIRCESTRQVTGTLAALDGHPALLLAGGSNVVLADDLADVTAVHIAAAGVTVDGSLLRAEAGANWDEVVALSLRAGLGGLNASRESWYRGRYPCAERGCVRSRGFFVTATSPGIEPRDRPGALVWA